MERFPEALDGLPDAIVIVDADGRIRAGNGRVEPVLGYVPRELEGTDIERLLYDPDDGSAGEQLHRYVADPEPRSMAASLDLSVRREDGTTVPVTVSLGPFEQDGETHLVVTIVDVRAERAEQAELHRRTEVLEALHEATQDLLKTTDREVAARAAVEYIEEVLGHSIAALWLYDEDRDCLDPVVWTDAAAEVVGPHPTFCADGTSISWEVFDSGEPAVVADTHTDPDRHNPDSPIRSELVLPLGRYGVINVGATEPGAFDNSDLAIARLWAATVTMVFMRIERERQLRARETEIARERDRLEEFASLVSHDLRNPLNVAVGNLDMVRERLETDHSEMVEIDAVARSLDRMSALVDDMLTLAKQGTAIDETEPVTLSELAETCWAGVDTAEAALVVGADLRLRADRSRLRQAVENLFANAVAHGGALVRVEIGALADGTGFYVADDGPGIPDDLRDEVFDAGISTDPDGTGFGLKIVAEVADAHGWSVSVADADGGGARFEFRGVDTAETLD
ncbi:multi-sensor signal transduction histidine kinase [Halorubrum aidingense JCM 13560]|uniref:histidine kinase n=1 Tax=Halorubrum aidingense JCM 13560 TaxID=1230454 RepID=M0PBE0_9EURY|nr:GAF domain-containing protein [Halorubrum aidingense]EMA66859.1 multi-sensor signal transduction histidine kinase [Halorubrum aidingense JCM 13560]